MPEPAKGDNPLEFVTVDEMLDELSRRFEGVVIAFETQRVNAHNDCEVHYTGGLTLCLGLSHRAALLMAKRATDSQPQPGEGEG